MQIEKEVVIRVKTSDGKILQVGDTVILIARGHTYIGKYMGIVGKGALQFDGIKLDDVQTRFAIMPSSITKIYKCNVELAD